MFYKNFFYIVTFCFLQEDFYSVHDNIDAFFILLLITFFFFCKTLSRNWMLEQALFFLAAQPSSFLIHLGELGHTVLRNWSPISSFKSFVTYGTDTIPDHWSQLSFTTQPLPTEAEDFPRGDKHPKHVPLPTYVACFSPKGISL